MAGAHRDVGLAVLAGPHVAHGAFPASTLAAAGASALALTGGMLDGLGTGEPWTDCLRLAGPAPSNIDLHRVPPAPLAYGPEQEAEVQERLRALGYLA